MEIKNMPVVNYSDLEDAFYEKYGYRVEILFLLFEDVDNDSYNYFSFEIAEKDAKKGEPEDAEDVLKVIKLFRDCGFDGNEVLIKVSW